MRVHSFPSAPLLSLEQHPLEASVSQTNMYDLTALSDDCNGVSSFLAFDPRVSLSLLLVSREHRET
jgi:hypothetical protein